MTPIEEQARAEQRKSEGRVLYTFWAALATGIGALLVFSVSQTSDIAGTWRIFALGVLVGGAAALIGALLGFLFGLPRGSAEGSTVVAPVPPAPPVPGTTANTETPPTKPDIGRRFGYVNNNLLEYLTGSLK